MEAIIHLNKYVIVYDIHQTIPNLISRKMLSLSVVFLYLLSSNSNIIIGNPNVNKGDVNKSQNEVKTPINKKSMGKFFLKNVLLYNNKITITAIKVITNTGVNCSDIGTINIPQSNIEMK